MKMTQTTQARYTHEWDRAGESHCQVDMWIESTLCGTLSVMWLRYYRGESAQESYQRRREQVWWFFFGKSHSNSPRRTLSVIEQDMFLNKTLPSSPNVSCWHDQSTQGTPREYGAQKSDTFRKNLRQKWNYPYLSCPMMTYSYSESLLLYRELDSSYSESELYHQESILREETALSKRYERYWYIRSPWTIFGLYRWENRKSTK